MKQSYELYVVYRDRASQWFKQSEYYNITRRSCLLDMHNALMCAIIHMAKIRVKNLNVMCIKKIGYLLENVSEDKRRVIIREFKYYINLLYKIEKEIEVYKEMKDNKVDYDTWMEQSLSYEELKDIYESFIILCQDVI